VHGANRLGGNGVADSIVYGGRAGDSMADYVVSRALPAASQAQIHLIGERWVAMLGRAQGESVFDLRSRLDDLMWEKVGVVRNGAALAEAARELPELRERAERARVYADAASNPEWNEAINLINLCLVGEMVARSALERRESRGAHYRQDFPAADPAWLKNIVLKPREGGMEFSLRPVEFTRMAPPELGVTTHASDLRHH